MTDDHTPLNCVPSRRDGDDRLVVTITADRTDVTPGPDDLDPVTEAVLRHVTALRDDLVALGFDPDRVFGSWGGVNDETTGNDVFVIAAAPQA